VEELESPKEKEPALKKGRITKDQFRSARVETAAKYASVKAHTYEVEAVTKASKPSGAELPFATDTGLGMSWGRIIHRMLEAMVREEKTDLELIAENLLKEEERLLSEKDLVVRTVKAVMASELWKRMKTAKEVLVEVPFSLMVLEESLPKVVSGVIDLAFRESDGWVIADYKTDKVDGRVDTLVAYYRPQIQMYSEFWEKMSGDRVKEAGLYFIDAGQWLTLQVLD
jgi:ATP-dependent helicase/nuclease subunit A